MDDRNECGYRCSIKNNPIDLEIFIPPPRSTLQFLSLFLDENETFNLIFMPHYSTSIVPVCIQLGV